MNFNKSTEVYTLKVAYHVSISYQLLQIAQATSVTNASTSYKGNIHTCGFSLSGEQHSLLRVGQADCVCMEQRSACHLTLELYKGL
jgi:hypothetical protein